MTFSNIQACAIALAAGFGLSSCDKFPGNIQKTANGLEYQLVEDKSGTNARLGDFITLHMSYFTDKDSLLNNTYKMGQPITSKVMEPMFKGSFEEGLLMLSEGDSANFWIPVDSIFKGQPPQARPAFLKAGSRIRYSVRVTRIETEASIEPNQIKAIEAYARAKNLKLEKTGSGLRYAITQPGTGSLARVGDTVKVHYVGTTLDGNKEFDNSRQRNEPFAFPVGKGMVIPGWDEGLQLLPEGTRAVLLIPSRLAYGEQGAPGSPIGPNSALVFDVEVVDVIPAPTSGEAIPDDVRNTVKKEAKK